MSLVSFSSPARAGVAVIGPRAGLSLDVFDELFMQFLSHCHVARP